MNTRVPQELLQIIVRSKQHAQNVQRIKTTNVAHNLQTVLPFASLMKKNVPHLVKKMVALTLLYVLYKNVIITVIYVQSIVQVFVMNIK
jgi:hypothetical protein